MSEYDMKKLAEKISQKVVQKQEEKEERLMEENERAKVLEEGTDFLVCKPCSTYSKTPDVPRGLVRSNMGGGGAFLGMIGKLMENGEKRPAWALR